MGNNTSSSSTLSSPDCYIRNKMMRQCSNNIENLQQSNKTQIGCDCQENFIECDENRRIIRVIKQNKHTLTSTVL